MLKILDIVLPPRCIVSGKEVDSQGMLCPDAWGELRFVSEPYCQRCGIPFDFDMAGGDDTKKINALCVDCMEHEPAYDSARSALVYDDISKKIILGLKHGDRTHFVPSLIPWLMACGAKSLEGADFLVPVPLHRFRLLRRRFNQSALIARALAAKTGVEAVPDGLCRIRATVSQGGLDRRGREENVKGAFTVDKRFKERLVGKGVVLIDDVFTTGATVGECCRVLRDSGAAGVSVLTVARVVKQGF